MHMEWGTYLSRYKILTPIHSRTGPNKRVSSRPKRLQPVRGRSDLPSRYESLFFLAHADQVVLLEPGAIGPVAIE